MKGTEVKRRNRFFLRNKLLSLFSSKAQILQSKAWMLTRLESFEISFWIDVKVQLSL